MRGTSAVRARVVTDFSAVAVSTTYIRAGVTEGSPAGAGSTDIVNGAAEIGPATSKMHQPGRKELELDHPGHKKSDLDDAGSEELEQ